MAPRSNMETLPENVRREFERRLIENGFANYTDLAAWLNQQGYQISRSAAYRYGSKIERRLRAIKESTEAAKLIVANADDEQDSRSEALMALLQNQLFEALIDISEKDSEELAPEARFDLLSEGGTYCRADFCIHAPKRISKQGQSKSASRCSEVAKAVKKDTVIRVKRNYINCSVHGANPTPPWLLKLPSFILNNDSLSSSNVVLPVVQICVSPG